MLSYKGIAYLIKILTYILVERIYLINLISNVDLITFSINEKTRNNNE